MLMNRPVVTRNISDAPRLTIRHRLIMGVCGHRVRSRFESISVRMPNPASTIRAKRTTASPIMIKSRSGR